MVQSVAGITSGLKGRSSTPSGVGIMQVVAANARQDPFESLLEDLYRTFGLTIPDPA